MKTTHQPERSTAEPASAAGPAGPAGKITPPLIEEFRANGVVWVPGLLSPAWLTLIDAGMRRNLSNPGPYVKHAFAGEPGEFYHDYCNYETVPEFRRLLADSPIAEVMARLLQTRELWLFYDQIFVKEGGYSRRTPWHQDTPYFMAEGEQIATMWITLGHLDAAESLEVVPGSHRGPVYNGAQFKGADATAPRFDAEKFPRLPDIESQREQWTIVSRASEPGDVLIVHPGALHGGAPMREGGSRRTMSIRVFGDDVVYAKRVTPEPPFPGVSEMLRPGDPLRHPWFPKLWPKD